MRKMLDTPFYTQRLTLSNYQEEGFNTFEEAENWTKRICGLACLKMVIAHIKGQIIPLKTLLDQGLSANGYMKGIGWIHQGLLDVAGLYGISGRCQSIGNDLDTIESALQHNHLVIASVSCGFNPEKKGGHLILIIGMKENGFILHHPSSEEDEQWDHYFISKQRFLKSFSVNGNIILIPLPEKS